MSSGFDEKMSGQQTERQHSVQVDDADLKEKNLHQSEVLVDRDLMVSAYDGENREHETTVFQAIRENKKACFWAFIFCFTIVLLSSLLS